MDEAPHDGGEGGFCKPYRAGAHIALVGRAVTERWPTTEEVRKQVADEMAKIALKRTTTVGGMEGPIEVDNDRNQTAAARVYAGMVGQNQADEHHSDKLHQDDKHLAVDMVAALAQQSREQKEALIRRAGLGHLLEAPSPSPTNK